MCDKSYEDPNELILHSNIHTKPYKCGICGKAYAISKYYKIHVKTHSIEKPFRCEICKKILVRQVF